MTSTKKMTKTEMAVKNYMEYAKNVDVHQKATKGVNSGAYGSAYEMQVKLALNNRHFNGVAKKGRIDTTKKINGKKLSFEIKQGCGELAIIDMSGKIVKSCFNTDYIIYCPDFDINRNVLKQSYIIATEEFIPMLFSIGLVRKKMSSAMYNRPESARYHDKLAIQSFLNSEKKTNLFYDLLEEKAESLESWIIENIK
jgi:hypothetical protein